MKLVGKEDEALTEGDSITVGVTHQIQISGENSWVKYEVVTKVRDGETTQMAKTRAVGHVNAESMELVHEVVDAVRKVTQ